MTASASAPIREQIQNVVREVESRPYDTTLIAELQDLLHQQVAVDAREASRQAAGAGVETAFASVGSFQSASDAAQIESSVDLTTLSPDAVLALVQRRLDNIDNAIRVTMSDVTAREADSKRLTSALELLNELGMTGSTDNDGDVADHEFVNGRPVPEVLSQLEALGIALPMSDHLVRRDVISHAIEAVNSELKQVNSSNEMTMIRLQDAMQSRTALLNLTTNVLNAMHEAEKNIIGNMRA